MGIEKLTKNSTPCEICHELGLVDEKYSEYREGQKPGHLSPPICSTKGYSETFACLQKDRVLIKLMYLNFIKKD